MRIMSLSFCDRMMENYFDEMEGELALDSEGLSDFSDYDTFWLYEFGFMSVF